MPNYVINSESGSEPVTLTEAKLWLKQDDIDTDDDLITGLIEAGRKYCEDYTGRSFFTKNISVRVTSEDMVNDKIPLKFKADPDGTISLTAYYQGSSSSIATTVWQLNEYDNVIELKYDQEWPDYEYIIVTYDTLNEGTSETVKLAIKNFVAAAYEYRNDRPNMPLTKINNYLEPLRLWQFQ